MCTRYLPPFLALGPLTAALFFALYYFVSCVEFRVVDVAGFVLRDPLDSPDSILMCFEGDVYFSLLIFSVRALVFICKRGLC